MKYLASEFIKLRKAKFIWGMSLVCISICVILFIQYTLNKSSGIAEPLLKQPQNSASFFIGFFSVFLAYLWAICIGSYLGTSEYKNGTIILHVQNSGRYYGVLCKILAFLVLTCIQIIALYLIGFVLSSIFFGFNFSKIVFSGVLGQILFSVSITFSLGIIGMTIGKLLKSAMASNMICLGSIFGLSSFPGIIGKYAFYLNPFSYLAPSYKMAFSNISRMSNFHVNESNWITARLGVICMVCLTLVLIVSQLVLSKFEQY